VNVSATMRHYARVRLNAPCGTATCARSIIQVRLPRGDDVALICTRQRPNAYEGSHGGAKNASVYQKQLDHPDHGLPRHRANTISSTLSAEKALRDWLTPTALADSSPTSPPLSTNDPFDSFCHWAPTPNYAEDTNVHTDSALLQSPTWRKLMDPRNALSP